MKYFVLLTCLLQKISSTKSNTCKDLQNKVIEYNSNMNNLYNIKSCNDVVTNNLCTHHLAQITCPISCNSCDSYNEYNLNFDNSPFSYEEYVNHNS